MSRHPSELNSGQTVTRRDVLRGGSLALAGTGLPGLRGPIRSDRRQRSCIVLFLTGGPSHIDTFDPKPDAPAEVRGPFAAIPTNVSGIQLTELLPRTARHADKFAIVRSLHHTAAGVHDTGFQQMQTGRPFSGNLEYPHAGCVFAYLRGRSPGDHFSPPPAHVLLPGPMGNTGSGLAHGQTAGFLGSGYDPVCVNAGPDTPWTRAADLAGETEALRDAYGRSEFGENCLRARRLVEAGAGFITINMFRHLHGGPTWDAHGSAPFGGLNDYPAVAAVFDRAYSTLLADLKARGLLRDTLLVAMGEFGRTPRINPAGGRDHWPGCWSILLAGGGIRGGQVVGASDRIGAAPADRPTRPAEVVATIYHCLGIDVTRMLPGPEGRPVPILEPGVQPIHELL